MSPISERAETQLSSAASTSVTELDQKAQSDLAPGLYLVATPIGHLRDITLRALDVLRGVDLVLAEDTRQTGKLLSAYDLSQTLKAYHDHNAAKRIPGLIKQLNKGARIALVSDAGTPLVSDPGFKLARDAIAAGIEVFPVPGASAVLAGLVKSGLPSDRFYFGGFLPAKATARRREIERLRSIPGTLVLFETGPRIEATLQDLATGLGNRDAVLARELTKHYEEARRGLLLDLARLVSEDPPKGELVVLIDGPEEERWEGERVRDALREALKDQKLKTACAELAPMTGWSKRELYALGLTLK